MKPICLSDIAGTVVSGMGWRRKTCNMGIRKWPRKRKRVILALEKSRNCGCQGGCCGGLAGSLDDQGGRCGGERRTL